jgi:hypothetical protein
MAPIYPDAMPDTIRTKQEIFVAVQNQTSDVLNPLFAYILPGAMSHPHNIDRHLFLPNHAPQIGG